MPDIFYILRKWWKQMLTVTVLSVIAVALLTFLKPRKYLSVATAVPASSFAADKSKIFSDNIEALYSSLGTPDDLDMIIGIARLDTCYIATAEIFNLQDHYKISEEGNAAITKSAYLLKANTRVMKSEYGELKVKVWDTDKNLAPQLANTIMEKLQAIHQNLQGAGNEAALNGLIKAKEKLLLQTDSIAQPEKRKILEERLLQYEKLISEYQLMTESKPPSLIIVEKAKASDWPDKPKRMQLLTAAALLGLLFSFFAALLLERRKNSAG